MDSTSTRQHSLSPAAEALSQERVIALQQLSAAWEMHVLRLEEHLLSGWKQEIERIFEERFREMAARMDDAVREARSETAVLASEQFHRAARRLSAAETDDDWCVALADAAASHASRAAVFVVAGEMLHGRRARGFDPDAAETLATLEAPLRDAPAFANAVSSGETVVSLRSAGELSGALAGIAGADTGSRAYLFPVRGRDGVCAVLYADGDADVHALEAVTVLAGTAMAARATPVRPARTLGLTTVACAGRPLGAEVDWPALSNEDQEMHLRAQRFARVAAAEMRLYKSPEVKAGRTDSNLYSTLKKEIDAGREIFRNEFLAASSSMVDYFHLELVRTLANDDVSALGRDYPGPLV